MTHPSPKLHNAMWPGLVGKGDEEGQEPPISLERMLELTAGAEVDGQKFEGVDYFLFHPHTDPDDLEDAHIFREEQKRNRHDTDRVQPVDHRAQTHVETGQTFNQ